jgi:mRNA-degrading endonuclease RelE of RelBE toxin-antitoxin system
LARNGKSDAHGCNAKSPQEERRFMRDARELTRLTSRHTVVDVNVVITPAAQQDFSALPVDIQDRVRALARRLMNWPEVSGAKPLRGELKGCFRLRTGDWRLIFRPVGSEICIVRIAHRREVYED